MATIHIPVQVDCPASSAAAERSQIRHNRRFLFALRPGCHAFADLRAAVAALMGNSCFFGITASNPSHSASSQTPMAVEGDIDLAALLGDLPCEVVLTIEHECQHRPSPGGQQCALALTVEEVANTQHREAERLGMLLPYDAVAAALKARSKPDSWTLQTPPPEQQFQLRAILPSPLALTRATSTSRASNDSAYLKIKVVFDQHIENHTGFDLWNFDDQSMPLTPVLDFSVPRTDTFAAFKVNSVFALYQFSDEK
ncbi:hypothetical protein HK405_006965 [Cladochytrium tenue]|nr:hypothetical protein HK405_006965 [Cladochytrium tenue]